jgi:dipeptidase
MCTVIAIGPHASADGSTWLTHSDTGADSRIRKIPAQDHPPGARAAVHWGLQEIHGPDLQHHGEVTGHIAQIAHTHAYFHSAYSHINEHQLALAESTTSQRPELRCPRGEGEQIMTIEQAMVFALQRCRRAREAVALVGELMERHGFLSSCGDGSELLVAADPHERWVMEIVGVGRGWQRASGEPGGIWAARRIPDDHVFVAANWSVLAEVDIDDRENVMACAHLRRFAEQRGWVREGGRGPFRWRDTYCPIPREWATGRLWAFYSDVAPSLRAWPERRLDGAQRWRTLDAYGQEVEPLDIYPFSVKPERLLTRDDLVAFHRSALDGTVYDMTEQPAWYVMDEQGQLAKSPLATPFPGPELRRLLKLTPRRPVARHFGHYTALCQLRRDRPDDVAGVYWVALDNPLVSAWVPIPLAVTSVHESFSTHDPDQFSEASARWCIDFVDNLMRLEFQTALPILKSLREPFEAALLQRWSRLDDELAAEPDAARRADIATAFSQAAMSELTVLYRRIREQMLVRLTNNRWV